ncbi:MULTISPECIES: BMP family protein [unclassified Nocardioides]|uniref:BMP family protein n=1 Tax=unclassified Nocardioides TaxID=2615069 RepID=UPI000056F77E|nr:MULTISPECIES: BMP family protein [unclassified Nocardioides]ABL83645.1 nucleoside-binding protein [Nocardioides sp. JS614]
MLAHPVRDRRPSQLRTGAGLLVTVAVLALTAACGGTTGDEGSDSAGGDLPLVYGVFATPLEEPWDGAIHAALESAAADGLIEYKHVDDLSTSDAMERSLRDIATNEKPDAIIGDAFAAEEAVRKVAAEFPDIPFAFGSGGEPVEPNMSVFDNWLQDPAYLAGMLAGGLTESGTIGVVGAMPIPEVNRIVNAFVLGVKETNPDATVKVSFINSFFDPAAAKQAAQAHISAGADVLFAERDGVIAAAEEADIPVIGMMVDQKAESPEHVVTSLIWDVRPTVDAVVDQIENGPEGVDLGKYSFMAAGGSSIADINTDIVGGVPDDLAARVEDMRAAMEDGTFETPVDESAPAKSIDVSAK